MPSKTVKLCTKINQHYYSHKKVVITGRSTSRVNKPYYCNIPSNWNTAIP